MQRGPAPRWRHPRWAERPDGLGLAPPRSQPVLPRVEAVQGSRAARAGLSALAVPTTLSTSLQQSVSKRSGGEGGAVAPRSGNPSCCRVCCPGCYRSRGRWKTTALEGPAGDRLAVRITALLLARSRAALAASALPPRCHKPHQSDPVLGSLGQAHPTPSRPCKTSFPPRSFKGSKTRFWCQLHNLLSLHPAL